jgi:hypothetical protein
MKGSSAERELAAAQGVIRKERGQVDGVMELGAGVVDPPVRVIRIRKH